MSYKSSLLNDIPDQYNAHLQGLKRVFIANDDNSSALTQFAYGIMDIGQQSGIHSHPTMDEYFFFVKGSGVCNIQDQIVTATALSFLLISSATPHNLINNGTEKLEFIYFGIAV